MLKVLPVNTQNFANLKCGEIYCLTAKKFTVSCCFCFKKIELEKFTKHFQYEHLHELENITRTLEISDPINNAEIDIDEIKTEAIEFFDEKPIDFVELQLGHMAAALPTVDELKSNEKKFEIKTGKKRSKDVVFNANEADLIDGNVSPTPSSVPASPADTATYKSDVDDEDNGVVEALDDPNWQTSDVEDRLDEGVFNPFPCTVCDKGFGTKRGMRAHMRNMHERQNEVEKNDDSEAPKTKTNKKKRNGTREEWKCDECNEVFPAERNLKAHKYKHTGIICDICGKPFSQLGNMQRHKIRHTGIKAVKCKECEMCFYTEKELNAHMMKHTGILPHICEICGRRCRDRGVLTAHMRRHTGERPAKCEVCGKCFFSGHDLNVHAVTHTTIRPFHCNICGSTFQRKKSLRVHKKLHSEVRNHQCKICGKGFTQSSGLNTHMRTHDAAIKSTVASPFVNVKSEQNVAQNTIFEISTIANIQEEEEEGWNMEIVHVLE